MGAIMASIKKTRAGTFQLCVKNKLLPKTFWATFDTHEAAEQYGGQLERLLGQGIVPAALLQQEGPKREAWTVGRCIAEYLRHNAVPDSDERLLDTIRSQLALQSTSNLNYDWAEGWITSLKREKVLVPSTIRHRHGALARCFDWMVRKHPEIMAQNPLRLLKRGFATYNQEDERALALRGEVPRHDAKRDRRLAPEEEKAITSVLAADELVFFSLALETAMRMRECYTLTLDQVSIERRTIHLDRTKNGHCRQVPLSSVAGLLLAKFIGAHKDVIAARGGRLFPYWSGDNSPKTLRDTTTRLSRLFGSRFEQAGVSGFHFHDLRHEGTCRLYERTTLSDVLIARITGHEDPRMLKRYASLRGSDLAAHLW